MKYEKYCQTVFRMNGLVVCELEMRHTHFPELNHTLVLPHTVPVVCVSLTCSNA